VTSHQDALGSAPLGHVIYASGIAASAAADPAYAFGVHVEGARRILAAGRFTSFLFLSSTRIYGPSLDTSEGAMPAVNPAGGGDVYRISKLAGEALCLADPRTGARVARLSNVSGESFRSPLFLSDVLRQAARDRRAVVHTTRDSAKDYVTIGDVCRYLISIAVGGRERLYNVAAGANVENGAIYDALHDLGVDVQIAADATRASTPSIDAKRLHAEFGAPREEMLATLPELLRRFSANAEPAAR
jgi:nucleoside-diphosphate-sugar epimerase